MNSIMKMKICIYCILPVLLILPSSCKKDNTVTNPPATITVPVVTTDTVSSITNNSAVCGGTITSDGGASITARGVCWGTSQNPTIDSSKTSDSIGVGNFISHIIGLTTNTTYYVRAYATNNFGTGYGNNVIFQTRMKQIVTQLKPLPEKTTVANVTINDKLFAIGNKIYALTQPFDDEDKFLKPRTVYMYDIQNNSWTKKAEMPVRKSGFSAACINDKIYTMGGNTASGMTNSVEEYDTNTDQWSQKTCMLAARNCAGSIALGDKIYMIGGSQPAGKPSIEVYNTSTDQWTALAEMPTTVSYWTTIVEINGIIYVIGGYQGLFEAYDISSNSWSRKSNTLVPQGPLVATAVEGKIYLFSYCVGQDNLTAQYDPATDTWTRKKNMPTRRGDCNMSVIDNKIYLIGGSMTPTCDYLISSIERYNPADDSWLLVGSMSKPKWYTGVAEVNKIIYVVGGMSVGNFYDDVEAINISLL